MSSAQSTNTAGRSRPTFRSFDPLRRSHCARSAECERYLGYGLLRSPCVVRLALASRGAPSLLRRPRPPIRRRCSGTGVRDGPVGCAHRQHRVANGGNRSLDGDADCGPGARKSRERAGRVHSTRHAQLRSGPPVSGDLRRAQLVLAPAFNRGHPGRVRLGSAPSHTRWCVCF